MLYIIHHNPKSDEIKQQYIKVMYNKEQSISISCDNCGDVYIDEHTGFSLYPDEIGAHEAADNDGWHSIEGEHYCPLCHTINDNDELIIDSSRTILHEASVPVREEVSAEDIITGKDIVEQIFPYIDEKFTSTELNRLYRCIDSALEKQRQSHPANRNKLTT